MAEYNVTNGVTSTGITLYDDSMYVSNGGKATNTTVNANGMLYVSNGGTADKTTVNGYWGYLYVSNGGTATNTLVNANGEFDVFSGGVAANTTVKVNGRLEVLAGGTATEITAVEGAYLGFGIGPDTYVKGTSAGSAFEIKDGIAANFTLNNGYLNVASDGAADNTTVNDGGYMWVSSDGVAANTTVKSGGRLGVRAGGTATKIAAVEGAYLEFDVAPDTYIAGTSTGSAFEIKDGSVANFTLDRGSLHVSAGGTADNTTVNHIGRLVVSSGGTANNTTLNKGYFIVSNGGTADNTTVNSGGSMWVSSGGKADNTTVNGISFHQGGYFDVSSGGTADNTTVNSGGYLCLQSGGTADNTTVNYWGTLYVEDGGTATNTTVNGSGNTIGEVWVYDSGILSNTTVNALGEIMLFGTATNTTVNSGGYLCLQSGGTATEIEAVDGAYLLFAVAPDTYAKGTSAGSAFEIKNGVATNFTLSCGELILYSGCTANKTTVSDSGDLVLRSAGKATNTTVNNGGVFGVSSGGTADKTTVNENGDLYVYGGGKANSTTVKDGGSMRVVTGGTANSVTVSSGGKLDLFEDGVLTGRMTFSSGALVSAYEGGGIIDFDLTHTSPSEGALVNDLSIVQGTPMYTLTVNGAQGIGAYRLADGASGFGSKTEITVRNPVGTDLGTLTVDSKSNTFSYGGKSYTLQLNDASLVIIVNSESGSPNIVTGDVNGQTIITEGSSALGATVNGGGMLVVQDGGKGSNVMVNNGGILMATGAQLKGVTVDKGGVAYIGSDATAKSLVINGGEAHIESDGWAFQTSKGSSVASNTIVKNGGMLYISGGGHVEGLLASGGGHVIVESDGALNSAKFADAAIDALKGADVSSVTLLDGGTMNVFAGGSAQSVHVSEGGILAVESGGELNNIKVSAGGILTGVVKGGTMIRMYGGTLDFDISGFTPDSAPAYLYEDTDIESDEAYPCTLTVGDSQAYGTYGLMSYAYGFGCTVTVQDTSGKELGTLAAGSAVNINGVDYTLNIGGSPAYPLTVTIADNEAPTILNIAADITDPTTSNVTVTAEFADNVKLASTQYRIGDGAWTDYAAGVVVTGNATVHFKATDAAGNSTEAQYEVTNIDKEKPTVTNVAADITAPTNQNVTVTADFEDNAGIAFGQYRIGDGVWTDYIAGVSMEENGTLSFKAIDMAGNESEIVSITIGNIDKVAPTITNITPSTTAPATSVTVTANFADNVKLATKQYRIGSGAWTDYSTGVTVTENTTVYFKAVDTAGNDATAQYKVTNIKTTEPDITPPTITITPSTTKPAKSVTLTAVFDDDVAVATKEYMIDSEGVWKSYTGPVTVTENVYVSFRATDTSENGTVQGYNVTNIEASTPENGPEEPYNNTLLTDTKDVNEKIRNAYGTVLTAAGQEIRLDKTGTVDEGGYHNHVGNSTSVLDDNYKLDYAKIVLEHGAELSFHAEATAAATFTVYSLTEKKGKYTLKKLQTLKLADKNKDGVFTADSPKLLSLSVSGAYYVSMQYADKRKDVSEAYYNVTLNGGDKGSVFYPLGDNSDDWGDMKEKGYAGAVGDLGVITDGTLYPISGEWAGFGDKVDCKKFTLASAAELSLSVSAQDGPLKLSVCRLKETTSKKGVTTYSQVTVKSVTVKAGQPKSLDSLRLAAGDYFFKVESTNVKKSTGYSVQIADGEFYTDGDDGWNNVLLDGKTLNENEAYFYDNKLAGSGAVHLDKAGNDKSGSNYATFTCDGNSYGGFVGFGDETDFAKLTLRETSDVTFTLDATNDATLEIFKVTEKNGKYSKKSLQTVKYKSGGDAVSSKKPVTLEVGDGVSYYVSVKATNIKKTTVDPRTYYNVSYDIAPKGISSALAMPETDALASALTMPDSLSFGQYDTDVLAGASADAYLDSASDKLFGETGNGLLASL